MTRALAVLARRIAGALRDLAPIILVIAFFQIVVLQQPFPNLGSVVVGLLCVVAGLTLFIQGLESGLFPLGEAIAEAFARKTKRPTSSSTPRPGAGGGLPSTHEERHSGITARESPVPRPRPPCLRRTSDSSRRAAAPHWRK